MESANPSHLVFTTYGLRLTGYDLRPRRERGYGNAVRAGKKAGDTHPNHIGGGTVARAYGGGALIAFSRGPTPAQDEDLDEDQRR